MTRIERITQLQAAYDLSIRRGGSPAIRRRLQELRAMSDEEYEAHAIQRRALADSGIAAASRQVAEDLFAKVRPYPAW